MGLSTESLRLTCRSDNLERGGRGRQGWGRQGQGRRASGLCRQKGFPDQRGKILRPVIPSLPCVSGRKGSLCHTKVIGSLPGFDVSLFNTYTWFVVFKCVLASSHAKVVVVSCSVLMVLIVLYCFGGYMAARQLLLSSATTVLNDLENDPLCHSPYLQEWVGMVWFVWEKIETIQTDTFS